MTPQRRAAETSSFGQLKANNPEVVFAASPPLSQTEGADAGCPSPTPPSTGQTLSIEVTGTLQTSGGQVVMESQDQLHVFSSSSSYKDQHFIH